MKLLTINQGCFWRPETGDWRLVTGYWLLLRIFAV
jgi:hypothetical protein